MRNGQGCDDRLECGRFPALWCSDRHHVALSPGQVRHNQSLGVSKRVIGAAVGHPQTGVRGDIQPVPAPELLSHLVQRDCWDVFQRGQIHPVHRPADTACFGQPPDQSRDHRRGIDVGLRQGLRLGLLLSCAIILVTDQFDVDRQGVHAGLEAVRVDELALLAPSLCLAHHWRNEGR